MLPRYKPTLRLTLQPIPTLRLNAGPRHHVFVWLFRNRYRQFEFTSLRQRVGDFAIFRARSAKSACVRRLAGLKFTIEILTGEIFAPLVRILSVSIFDGGL